MRCTVSTSVVASFAFASSLCGLATQAAENGCGVGCRTTWQPVCGAGGVTYANACIADCQGIDEHVSGTCGQPSNGNMDATISKPDRIRDDVIVSQKVMDCFKDEGFVFSHVESFAAHGTHCRQATAADGSAHRRLSSSSSSGTRAVVKPYNKTPYAAVGLLDAELDTKGNPEYLCSGALVGEDAVLTAGHCVYDVDPTSGKPAAIKVGLFVPALAGQTAPYGLFPVLYATSFSQWLDSVGTDNENYAYDMAVLRLDVSTTSGKNAYYMGIDGQRCPLPSLSVVGYPGDKTQTMWASNKCQNVDYKCGTGIATTTCDWTTGDSGAPAWAFAGKDYGNLIYGIVSHHIDVYTSQGATVSTVSSAMYPEVTNDLTMMTRDKFEWVYYWATAPLKQLESS
ncbi:trypsin-like cysteine/serine peptidase domain-containing protein [Tribonema minus]|uniref:Trypsin-like cysteine/serine peptidase domain-containing protein n=1 Tax=Tribonema minus TaxID=303371 RepID=A0A836CF25_9STRA|nr:trypsin-like cysteine/serine peptidase domain-containing protein [Tribonema minus]